MPPTDDDIANTCGPADWNAHCCIVVTLHDGDCRRASVEQSDGISQTKLKKAARKDPTKLHL
jgi:hypothetical protein